MTDGKLVSVPTDEELANLEVVDSDCIDLEVTDGVLKKKNVSDIFRGSGPTWRSFNKDGSVSEFNLVYATNKEPLTRIQRQLCSYCSGDGCEKCENTGHTYSCVNVD